MKKKICGQTCECKTEDDCHFQHLSTWKGKEFTPIEKKGSVEEERTVIITLSELEALGYKSPDEVKSIVEKVLERAADYAEIKTGGAFPTIHYIDKQSILNTNWEDLI